MPSGPVEVGFKRPKQFFIPSREFGPSADDAADILLTAREIRSHKKLREAAHAVLVERKKAIAEEV